MESLTPFELQDRPVLMSVHGVTDRGLTRSENQDSFVIANLGAANLVEGILLNPYSEEPSRPVAPFALSEKGVLLLVADGMGGAAAGGVASEMAVGWIHQTLSNAWSQDRLNTPQQFAQRLREAVEEANARIHEHSLQAVGCYGMGTTTTAAGVLGDVLYLAQVGDSRAYLIREGRASQLTRDQSFVQRLVEEGTLTPEEAEHSDHANVILQALGPEPAILVDMTFQEIRRGDTLLICSDGLYRVAPIEDMADIVRRSDNAAEACARLVELANERGGPDNITVIVAHLDGLGLLKPAAEDAIGRQEYRVTSA